MTLHLNYSQYAYLISSTMSYDINAPPFVHPILKMVNILYFFTFYIYFYVLYKRLQGKRGDIRMRYQGEIFVKKDYIMSDRIIIVSIVSYLDFVFFFKG